MKLLRSKKQMSPRYLGTLEHYLVKEKKKKSVVFNEYLFCRCKNHCERTCTFRIRWVIWNIKPHLAYIYTSGTHGDDFVALISNSHGVDEDVLDYFFFLFLKLY